MLSQEDKYREEKAKNLITKWKDAFSKPKLTHFLCRSTKRHCAFSRPLSKARSCCAVYYSWAQMSTFHQAWIPSFFFQAWIPSLFLPCFEWKNTFYEHTVSFSVTSRIWNFGECGEPAASSIHRSGVLFQDIANGKWRNTIPPVQTGWSCIIHTTRTSFFGFSQR